MTTIRQWSDGWVSTHESPDGPVLWWRLPEGPMVFRVADGWAIQWPDGEVQEPFPSAASAKNVAVKRMRVRRFVEDGC
jgi:hypothetical protein